MWLFLNGRVETRISWEKYVEKNKKLVTLE